MIERTSNSRSLTLKAVPSWRRISPCVRNSGGSPTRRCKSELPDWTSARRSLPSLCSAALYSDDANSLGRAPGAAEGSAGGLSTMGAAAMTEARGGGGGAARSEEHTSELQSRFDLVCRLLLE